MRKTKTMRNHKIMNQRKMKEKVMEMKKEMMMIK